QCAASVRYAAERIAAGRGLLQSADDADECGFARAVFAHKAVNSALGHPHGQMIERLKMAVVFTQVFCFQHIVHSENPPFVWDGGILPQKGMESGQEKSKEFVKIFPKRNRCPTRP